MEEYIRLLLDTAPISCNLWSPDGTIVGCNEECVRVFGVSSKQEYCERIYEFSTPFQPCGKPTRQAMIEKIQETFEKGYIRFEWLHLKGNGDPLPAEVTLVRVTYKGDFFVVSYVRDLTEHNRMLDLLKELHEKAEELSEARDAAECANQAKSSFLANMSHEMRTPLNVVVGLTDLHMEEESLPEAIYNDIRKINTAGHTLFSIVNDVLDISKIEVGKLELVPVEYNAASLLNDIIALNTIRIQGKPITFNVDLDEDMPCEIYGDELRLKQIFNNLLSNAFKYTEKGSVTLRVRCERRGDEDLCMKVSVSDTGIGIRKEDLEKLFSDYNQVDMRANRKIEGTGLGLSITKKLVELMDGKIWIESEYGKGTTFYLRLKQKYVNDKKLGKETVENLRTFRYRDDKQHASAKLVRLDMGYARVLVVDDFQTNLDVASGLIGKYKIKVDCVTSGQAAIDRIDWGEPRYDAIFMDHMMPEMDGIEATRRIRALDSEYARTVPIFSLTANAIIGNEKMFLESGFQEFLSKPIDIMKLDAVLRKWIRDKSKEKAMAGEPAVAAAAMPVAAAVMRAPAP
ncbi:MAG: ATP-binding protein, partial [Eggerthellaceae bacterium]|nr:ATP-binding protein [Eggerthellaceae bacterium]